VLTSTPSWPLSCVQLPELRLAPAAWSRTSGADRIFGHATQIGRRLLRYLFGSVTTPAGSAFALGHLAFDLGRFPASAGAVAPELSFEAVDPSP